MFSLLPLVLALVFAGSGGPATTSDLGFDTQRLDTSNISRQTDEKVETPAPAPCTTLCQGTAD
jgi:hypothetical protein